MQRVSSRWGLALVLALGAGVVPAAWAQTALTRGVAVTGLSGAASSTKDFSLVVPAGATALSFKLSGGTGDADLYMRRAAVPTTSTYDCRSNGASNAETCSVATPTAATYYVRLVGYAAYSGASLVATYTPAGTSTAPVVLQNNVALGSQGAAQGAWLRYTIDVPTGATNLVVTSSGGSGAADLYVRAGSEPTTGTYDCRPFVNGNNETCSFAQPQVTRYHIGLYGYQAFSGVTIKAQYTAASTPPGGGATWSGFQAYYVQAIGKTGVALRTSLNQHAALGHVRRSYADVWEALKYTDEDPANTANVILIYTGRSQAKTYNASGNNDPDAWNREHVWPKSHGFPNESQWAHTDIHHLRPADVSVNSTRGDKDFDWGGSAIGEAPGNLTDADSFEPRNAVKGDIARMIFYMAVRYEGNDTTGVGNLEMADNTGTSGNLIGKRCTLMTWHRQDPVDDSEVRRHARIVERQGNRNPFVDYPAWAEELFGAGCP
ncbi:MAG: endonuclease [Rubrivivax sp.]